MEYTILSSDSGLDGLAKHCNEYIKLCEKDGKVAEFIGGVYYDFNTGMHVQTCVIRPKPKEGDGGGDGEGESSKKKSTHPSQPSEQPPQPGSLEQSIKDGPLGTLPKESKYVHLVWKEANDPTKVGELHNIVDVLSSDTNNGSSDSPDPAVTCTHTACKICGGSGIRKRGKEKGLICPLSLSCSCPKCMEANELNFT